MKVTLLNAKRYQRGILAEAGKVRGLEFSFLEPKLDVHTAVLSSGHVPTFPNVIVTEHQPVPSP
ncbi:MAG: hypothetical protein ACOYOI_03430 [Chthoniobacterales bacterium]